MFPLGSVLFPHMPLPLRIFEPRYLAMLADILGAEPSEFGVVLIERGQEVGGGDSRNDLGTIAQVVELGTSEQSVMLIARGSRRIAVTKWHEDDPYPKAEVEPVGDIEWSQELQPLRDEAEQVVRRVLARASEWGEYPWPADVELSDEPVPALWQLAAISPLGSFDQMQLLRASSAEDLLRSIVRLVSEAEQTYH